MPAGGCRLASLDYFEKNLSYFEHHVKVLSTAGAVDKVLSTAGAWQHTCIEWHILHTCANKHGLYRICELYKIYYLHV